MKRIPSTRSISSCFPGATLSVSCFLMLAPLMGGAQTPAEPQQSRANIGTQDSGKTTSHDSKQGFVGDIEQLTTGNTDFRRVLYTGAHLQLVLMSLEPGEEIGEEVHSGIDQFVRVEQGRGQVIINGKRHEIEDDDAILVPAGATHNVINTGDGPLKLYTVYGPPEHRDAVVRATKARAMATDDHFDGKTTE